MSIPSPLLDDVFSVREVARAAGTAEHEVRALVASGRVSSVDGRFFAPGEAILAVRLLRSAAVQTPVAPPERELEPRRDLFDARPGSHRHQGVPFAASAALHAGFVALVTLLTTLGVRGADEPRTPPQQARLVFLALPGPGGGGGGGGLRRPVPPPKAKLEGKAALRSPVPVERTVKARRPEPPPRESPRPPVRSVEPVPRPVDPPPPVPKTDPIPPVVAPVVSAAADERDRPGLLTETAADADSRGPGSGGGSGSGNGAGIGEGNGSGIGPGSGAGAGGGPYRPGTGITPPSILREVKPEYTEDARRRNLEGDVVLEVVVRADGSVGSVRLLQALGSGLDQRASEAVRQWRFDPARRHGTPVDVLVEVAVEFRLR